jgi:hypothetical protein
MNLDYLQENGFFNTMDQEAQAMKRAQERKRNGSHNVYAEGTGYQGCVWTDTINDSVERGRALRIAAKDLAMQGNNILDERPLSEWSCRRLSESLNTSQTPRSAGTG